MEGVAAPTSAVYRYDGVDCALFYGDTTIERASRVELLQLKYSTADPAAKWTIARLTANSAKTGNNSVLRKLADTFIHAVSAATTADIVIRLVSNQPIDPVVQDVMQSIQRGDTPTQESDRIATATGLTGQQLLAFLSALDFSEMAAGSRSLLLDSLTFAVSDIVNGNADAQVLVLQGRIRQLMLPGAELERITQNTVLSWFGLNSVAGLFPAPPDLQPATNPIDRLPARELLSAINSGNRLICLHGQGGCGKTTTLMQLPPLLPSHSVSVTFDCYGAGRYTHTNDRRHLPENAFLQIVNELAWAQETPFLIANASTNPATIRTFLEKVESSARVLSSIDAHAILAILIDAADNSVAAAELSHPPSPCFIWEMTQADLGKLPPNVRIILSTRTARKSKLRLPKGTPEVECPAFTPDETQAFVRSRQLHVTESWIEQFHALSNGIPRVQSYALAKGAGLVEAVLDALRPHGKRLDTVLRELYQAASTKSGDEEFYVRCVAALETLPAPIPIEHLAGVCKCSVNNVVDFVSDVQPTLRIEDETVTIADEDVEDFLRTESTARLPLTLEEVCEYLSTRFRTDPYAAVHYCDFLERTSRAGEILPIVECDLLPAGITDPIVRREVQLRRLRLALRACRSAGSASDTLKVVLLSAEAAKDEDAFRGLLEQETDLSVRFASSSLFRLVLADRDRYPKQGSILAQDAVRAALGSDFVSARERLNAYKHWMERRNETPRDEWDQWQVEIEDINAIVEAIAIMEGAAAARIAAFRWRPVTLWPRLGLEVIPRLIARGQRHIVEAAYRDEILPAPWSLLLTVPLALSGFDISIARLAHELAALRTSNVPDLRSGGFNGEDRDWRLPFLEMIVTACEIGLSRGVAPAILSSAIQLVLDPRRSPPGSISETEPLKIDIALRAWLIRNHLSGKSGSDAQFTEWLKGDMATPKKGRGRRKKKTTTPNRSDSDRLVPTIKAIFPVYASRLDQLATRTAALGDDSSVPDLSGLGGDSYYFDRSYWFNDSRRRAAQSIVRLMHLRRVSVASLYEHAESIAKGDHQDLFGDQLLPVWRELLLRPSMHQAIVDGIATRAASLRALRAGAKSKADALTRFSRLVANFSVADAKALFERAMELILEIDREAMVQIEFVASLAPKYGVYGDDVARALAARHAAFVTDVAIRLEGEEHFPWESATDALTNLAPEVALATISQLQDEGIAKLSETLPSFLSKLATLSVEDLLRSCALLILLPQPTAAVYEAIADAARSVNEKISSDVFNKLAAYCLLHVQPHHRVEVGNLILSKITDDLMSGPNVRRLRDAVVFSERKQSSSIQEASETKAEIKFRSDADLDSVSGIAAAITDTMESERDRYVSLRSVLAAVRERVSSPAQRIPYLEAVAQFDGDSLYANDRAAAILAALGEWQGGPAIDRWRTSTLPNIITHNLWALSRWMHERSDRLTDLLNATGASAREKVDILARGLEEEAGSFSSTALFSLAKIMVSGLTVDESQGLAEWYVARLHEHVPPDIRSRYIPADIPRCRADALGRFLFSQMSDIDVRVRWRAAHCVRQLVTLVGADALSALFRAYDRKVEQSFRLPTAPFYWLSARLWAVMTAARIAAEDPAAASTIASKLVEIALDGDLPHYLIKANAKQALEALVSANAVAFSRSELRSLAKVNRPKKKMVKPKDGASRDLERYEGKKQRFHFDHLDTVRYWYAALYRQFATLTPDKFFRTLEKWLIDRWKADPEANWWNKEPRRSRYSDREQMSSSHSHGSQPTVERYGTYLEWHAMFCALGEWLEWESLAAPKWESDTLDYYMRRWTPTEPPAWLADRRSFTPLETDFVFDEGGEDKHWLGRVPKKKFVSAAVHDAASELTINGRWTISRAKRQTEISISSALVNSDTATSLLRTMQTADEYKFFLPMEREDDDHDIDRDPYILRSWLTYGNSESQFDEKDPLRNDVGGLSVRPANWLLKKYQLEEEGVPVAAWRGSANHAWFAYYAWADFNSSEGDQRYAQRHNGASGFRLKITVQALRKILAREKLDLIVKVQIERRLENEYGRSSGWDDKERRRTAHRSFIFRQDGTIEDEGGRIGTWNRAEQVAGRSGASRSARELDGASPGREVSA